MVQSRGPLSTTCATAGSSRQRRQRRAPRCARVPPPRGAGGAGGDFLPSWAWGWEVQLRIVLVLRILLALVGLLLILFVAPRLDRSIAAGRGREIAIGSLSVALAVTAAFGVTESVLRTRTWRSVQER